MIKSIKIIENFAFLSIGLIIITDWRAIQTCTSLPRHSLCPTVQPETYPFRRAKSTARTTSLTQNLRPLGFCHCWSVRLERFSRPCPQPERHRSFQALVQDIFVRTVLVHRAHYVVYYVNLHFDFAFDFDIINVGVDLQSVEFILSKHNLRQRTYQKKNLFLNLLTWTIGTFCLNAI